MNTDADSRPSRPRWVSVALSGEVDGDSVDALRLVLGSASPDEGVAIDLSAVTVLDPTGIGAIVGAARRLNDRGTRAAVICGRPGLAGVLRANRIEEVAVLVASEEEIGLTIEGAPPIAC